MAHYRDTILDLKAQQLRKARKTLISQINHISSMPPSETTAGDPFSLTRYPGNEIDDLFSRIVQQYITSKRMTGLNHLFLSDKLARRATSPGLCDGCRDLIDAGYRRRTRTH